MTETARLQVLACMFGIAALTWAMTGCGSDAGAKEADSGSAEILSVKETKRLLRQLPYHYKFRSVATPEGAEGAVAGRAIGRHHTGLNFGIALGHGNHGVPVPRAGTSELYGYPKGGFIFTSDEFIKGPDGSMVPNPRLKTSAQWREAGHMEVTMTDKLCLAVTGEHCPP